jgi:hypothetical protein
MAAQTLRRNNGNRCVLAIKSKSRWCYSAAFSISEPIYG